MTSTNHPMQAPGSPTGPPSLEEHRRTWDWVFEQRAIASSVSQGVTAVAPTLPVMVPPNVPNVPCNCHHQAPRFCPTNSGTAQYPQDTNNVQQCFASMSQICFPVDIPLAPWPVPDDINVLLGRDDADWNPWVPQFNLTPTEPNWVPLRATLPAPFLYAITMDMVTKNNIIPVMIHQRLIDLRDIRVFYPRPYFTMPDTCQYAQFPSPASASTVASTIQRFLGEPFANAQRFSTRR